MVCGIAPRGALASFTQRDKGKLLHKQESQCGPLLTLGNSHVSVELVQRVTAKPPRPMFMVYTCAQQLARTQVSPVGSTMAHSLVGFQLK